MRCKFYKEYRLSKEKMKVTLKNTQKMHEVRERSPR